jgi:hypothetical protein
MSATTAESTSVKSMAYIGAYVLGCLTGLTWGLLLCQLLVKIHS